MPKKTETQVLRLKPVAGTKNKVFVQPIKPAREKVMESGIIVPLQGYGMQENPENKWEKFGTVLSVSEADELGVKPNTKAGDVVYFDQNFKEDEFEGVTFLVMKEGNIYGKL